MSLFGFLRGTPREELDTRRLLVAARARLEASTLATGDAQRRFIIETVSLAGDDADSTPGSVLAQALLSCVDELLHLERPLSVVPADRTVAEMSLQDGLALRTGLRSVIAFSDNETEYLGEWQGAVTTILGPLLAVLPSHLFVDPDEAGNFEDFSSLVPHAPLHSFIPDVPTFLQRVVSIVLSSRYDGTEVFAELRPAVFSRLCAASKITQAEAKRKPYILPIEKTGLPDEDLIDLYLFGTPFHSLLAVRVPLYIPEALRYEHTHIIAGTGHGKTQTLQYLIASDLARDPGEKRALVVMDSQGDLLDTLMRSDLMASDEVKERFIYVNPMDLELPIGLNLFDSAGFGATTDPIVRETILNGTVELYEYFFSALIGAELTQKQGVVFRYIAHLLVHIPGASIHTLRELMEDGRKFMPYIERLPGSARVFFETRFFDRTFSETKKQVLTRLFGVMANQTLDRMMGSPRNSVDLFRHLQDGAIVFINTAKDFLGHEGSAIFSRLFVALLGQALIRRASVPKHERTPTYIYIDEAQDTVDLTLTRLLSQVRKYRGAITFAHQNLDQLAPEIRAGVIANTSIKLAGGLSAKDAGALAADFRVDSGFLLSQRKGKKETHFACFAKNVTERAITLPIPLGYVESKWRRNDQAHARLVRHSRLCYGVAVQVASHPLPVAGVVDIAVPVPQLAAVTSLPANTPIASPIVPVDTFKVSAPVFVSQSVIDKMPPVSGVPMANDVEVPAFMLFEESTTAHEVASALPMARRELPSDTGGRGAKHKYLQQLIKELGEARGFRATLEQPVHDGTGRVDVVLVREDVQIAFEVSVTTTKDHELGNIEKCLALPFTHVVMIASHARHLKSLRMHIAPAVDTTDGERLLFLLPDELPTFLDGFQSQSVPEAKVVKGYAVRSRVKSGEAIDGVARRRAIAKVVAKVAELPSTGYIRTQ